MQKNGKGYDYMKTLSYVYGYEEEIEIGNTYYFGQLWDGEYDGEELLDSCEICVEDESDDIPIIVGFKRIKENNEDILQTIIEVTNIY